MTVLVSFTKDDDIQYHVFTECKDRFSFVFDSLFKAFVYDHGYTWSSLQFPEELAYKCGFTISKCEVL